MSYYIIPILYCSRFDYTILYPITLHDSMLCNISVLPINIYIYI